MSADNELLHYRHAIDELQKLTLEFPNWRTRQELRGQATVIVNNYGDIKLQEHFRRIIGEGMYTNSEDDYKDVRKAIDVAILDFEQKIVKTNLSVLQERGKANQSPVRPDNRFKMNVYAYLLLYLVVACSIIAANNWGIVQRIYVSVKVWCILIAVPCTLMGLTFFAKDKKEGLFAIILVILGVLLQYLLS